MKKHLLLVILSFFSITFLNAQEKAKDTLFFKLDNKYIYQSKFNPKSYLLQDSSDNETFLFQKIETINILKPKKINCLKKFVHQSQFYNKTNNIKLNAHGLWEYFNNYTIFLVENINKKTKYIKVEPNIQLE